MSSTLHRTSSRPQSRIRSSRTFLGNDSTGGSLPAGAVRIELTQVLAAAVGLSHDPLIEPEAVDPSEEPAT